jgi:aromatic ring-cleaving dioxygenase
MMKSSHKVFFAIPFDSATKNMYESIRQTIRVKFPSVTTVIGNQEIGPSQKYSDIASFKAQNQELMRQFVHQIRNADIVIADLTNNNPNVHVELGIALVENKNILRVTGRPVTELGFDVRGLEVHPYKDEAQLTATITDYLTLFFEIKKLPISNHFPQLYFKEPGLLELRALDRGIELDVYPSRPNIFRIRDGAIKVEFEILKARKPEDWFGIYLRVGSNIVIGSYLVYVREKGSLEILSYPERQILKTAEIGHSISGRHILTVEMENDYLEASIAKTQLTIDNLSHQIAGHIHPASFYANVNIYAFEMISRDTIDW